MIGRLRDGAGLSETRQQLSALSARQRQQVPVYADYGWELRAEPLHEALVRPARPMLSLLLGSAAFVLAIACANIMHLVLVRAQGRAAEIGMRLALGASRARLVRLLLVECLLLAGTAGILGFALAIGGQRLLMALRPEGLPRMGEVALGSPTLLFAAGAVAASTLLFGLWPAWRAARTDLSMWMRGWRAEGHGAVVGPWLVATEVALSLILLAGAGLLLQSLLRLQNVDPGYAVDDVFTFSVSLPSTSYDYPTGTGAFLERLEAEVETLPGIDGAAPVWPAPLEASRWTGDLETPGGTTDRADYRLASAPFFELMGLSVLEGRVFAPTDERSAVVVSRSLAARVWPGQNAIGRTLRASPWGPTDEFEVIGVVEDARLWDLRETAAYPTAFFDSRYWSWADWEIHWVARSRMPESALVPMLQERLAVLDAQVPLADFQPLRDAADQQMSLSRFALVLVGVFAAVAALLATVGLYGVVAYSVNRRRREMGIRMALGSARSDIVALVLGRGGRWVAAGVAAGLAGAVLLGHSLETLLFEVGPRDPRTLAAVALVVAAIGIAACLLPALRASRVDPAHVLRAE